MNTNPKKPHGDNLAPIAWATMSPPGYGKSHDLLATWGNRAIYVVKDFRGLRMARQLRVELDLRHPAKGGQVLVTQDPDQIVKLARWYRKKYRKTPFHERKHIAFAVDEFSGIMKRRETSLLDEYEGDKMANMIVYGAIKREGIQIKDALCDLDAHMHATFEFAKAHVRKQRDMPDEAVQAQMDLPGRQLSTALAYAFDSIGFLRKAPHRFPYPVEYTRDPGDDEILDKDRLGVLTESTPLCTREILLSVGFWLPPFRSEGEERYIETLAQKVEGIRDPEDPEDLRDLLRREASRIVTDSRPLSVVTNMFYRACARAELRRKPDFYASLLGNSEDSMSASSDEDTTTDEE